MPPERPWQGHPSELSARDQGDVNDLLPLEIFGLCREAHPDMGVQNDDR